MPAAIDRLLVFVPAQWRLRVQPFHLVVVATVATTGLLLGALSTQASAGSQVHPLYPHEQSPVVLADYSQYTVAQIIAGLSATSKFYLMLYNGGALPDIQGEGPYTIFAPANNAVDYAPRDMYALGTQMTRHALAEHHIVSGQVVRLDSAKKGDYLTQAGDTMSFDAPGNGSAAVEGGFVIGGYKAKNGVVYLINTVLVPQLQ